MSKYSTPMDRKIQKDWAEVMRQFELPGEESNIAAVDLVSSIHSTKTHGKTSKVFYRLTLLGAVTLGAAVLYSTQGANMARLFKTTTLTSVVPESKPIQSASADASNRNLHTKTTQKPRYVTESMPIILSSLQTLAAKKGLDQEYHFLDESNWKTYSVSTDDKLDLIFYRLGIKSKDSKALTNNLVINKQLEKLTAGDLVRAEKKGGKLTQLITYKPNANRSFVITLNNNSYKGQFKRNVIETQETRRTVFIRNSLIYDAGQYNIPRHIVRDIRKIFDRDVNLVGTLKKGDRLTLVFEQIYHRGNKIADGKILAAELVHKKRAHRAIRFTQADGKVVYLDERGYDLSLAFRRVPLNHYKRVSSKFGRRRHPISHRIHTHTGVDFAAKRGEPVSVTGNGVVQLVARKGGYGQTVIVKHSGGYSTLYGHLSKFAKDLKPGKKVYLGDVIGYVGSSGYSTGPHLHYEFRVNGIPKNPQTVELPKSLSLSSVERKRFKEDSHNLIRQLDVLQRFAKENVDINSAIGG